MTGSGSHIPVVRTGVFFLCLTAFLVCSGMVSLGQNNSKSGGICFRIDDNPSLTRLVSLDSLFSLHQKKFCLAITSWSLPMTPDYVTKLKEFSASGHEILDNTPTHQTSYFMVMNIADTALYSNSWGVDHINGQQVCLKYTSVDLSTPHGEGPLNVFGNLVISANPGEFSDLNGNPFYFALFIQFKDRPYLWYDLKNKNPNDPDSLRIKSFWGEPVDIGTHWWFSYKKLTQREVFMHPAGISLLGKRSQMIFDDLGMEPPTTWIHPSGPMPWLNAYEVKSNLGDSLGYTCGSNYSSAAYFCFNEVNPSLTKQFALQSGDISIENHSFKWNRSRIAEAVAKHYVKVDLSYLSNPDGGWHSFLQRLDSLLTWCTVNQVPVKTYQQWSAQIYDSLTDRGVNVFPKLNADLDADGFPDGYDQDTATLAGHFLLTDGVASSGGKSFEIAGAGNICRITTLGGIEKGSNKFTISVKRTGADSTNVNVLFSFPETGATQTLVFPVDTNIWVEQYQIVNVPENASLMNILIRNEGLNTDSVRVSGMGLRSTGFLKRTILPDQEVMENEQFHNVDLNALVNDSVYAPNTVTWTIGHRDTMDLKILSGNILQVLKPCSFWTGRDSTYLHAESEDGFRDSCFMKFISNPLENGCSGVPITLTLLDTLDNDIIRWTSIPFDSAFTDTTIYNPTVSPLITTQYKVMCINPLGNINYDSITLIRYPFPDPGLPVDTVVCSGDSVLLTALEGIKFLWSTGDTTASIWVKPDESTTYTVMATSAFDCSQSDSTLVIVSEKPVVKLNGLRTAYCRNDWAATIYGTPPGGTLGATAGLIGNQFYPDRAFIGENKVWYTYISPTGCGDTDTVTVNVYNLPQIKRLPDTTLCAGKSLILNAGGGFDNYQWSNGAIDSITMVDSSGFGIGTKAVWVYVTKNGCANKDTAYIQFVICPGMNDQALSGTYLVYPNPVSSELIVKVRDGQTTPLEIRIVDMTGLVIRTSEHRQITNVIPVQDLIPGIYLIRIIRGSEVANFRFIKL